VALPKPFLKPGAFHLQQIQSLSVARLVRRLGSLTESEMEKLEDKLSERLFS
jgi:mRNA-degrading endonuclease toxin of MazEF toxin-antitoxin module